jgi:hypothetical protein
MNTEPRNRSLQDHQNVVGEIVSLARDFPKHKVRAPGIPMRPFLRLSFEAIATAYRHLRLLESAGYTKAKIEKVNELVQCLSSAQALWEAEQEQINNDEIAPTILRSKEMRDRIFSITAEHLEEFCSLAQIALGQDGAHSDSLVSFIQLERYFIRLDH